MKRPGTNTLLLPVIGALVSILVFAGTERMRRHVGQGPYGAMPFLGVSMLAIAFGAAAGRLLSARRRATDRWRGLTAPAAAALTALAGILGLAQPEITLRAARLFGPYVPLSLDASRSLPGFFLEMLPPFLPTGAPLALAAFLLGLVGERSAGRVAGLLLTGSIAGLVILAGGPVGAPALAGAASASLLLLSVAVGLAVHRATPRPGLSSSSGSDGEPPIEERRRRARAFSRKSMIAAGFLVIAGASSVVLLAGLFRCVFLATGDGSKPRLALTLVTLTGGGFGALMAPRAMRRAPGPWRLLGGCLALAGALGLLATLFADQFPAAYLGILARTGLDPSGAWSAICIVAVLALLGPALFTGAALGIAGDLVPASLPVVFSSLGGAAGSLWVGGLVPAVGLEGALMIAGCLLTVSGGLIVFLEEEARWGRTVRAFALLLLCAGILWKIEPWDRRLLTSGVSQDPALFLEGDEPRLAERIRHDRVYSYREGTLRTAALKLVEGRLPVLFLDGSILSLDGLEARRAQAMAGHLPALLGPDRGRALVLAMGAPATVEALLSQGGWDVEIAAADAEAAEVADAPDPFEEGDSTIVTSDPPAGTAAGVAAGGAPGDPASGMSMEAPVAAAGAPGGPPRAPKLLPVDAIRALRMPGEGYDLILAPTLVRERDIVRIFDAETLSLMRAGLRPGGLISIPVPLRALSHRGVETAIDAFGRAFPGASAWIAGSDLILVAGEDPNGTDIGRLGPRSRRPDVAVSLSKIGLDDPLKILSLRVMTLRPGAPAGAREGVVEAEDLARGAEEARLHSDLAENLAWIRSRLASGEVEIVFPGWWTPEAREAVTRRLAILRSVQGFAVEAHAALVSGEFGRALEASNAALALDPADSAARSIGARSLASRAASELAAGDRAAAADDDERAIQMDPESVEALTALSWMRREEGRTASAEILLRKAIEAAPRAALLRYRLGIVRLEAGDVEEAEKSLLASFDLDPRQPEPLLALGDIARRRGLATRAHDLYERALTLGGREAETRTSLASLDLEQGRLDEASREVESALRAKPGDPEALLTRALVRATRGERDGARRDLLSSVTAGGPPYRARAMANDLLRGLLEERPGRKK